MAPPVEPAPCAHVEPTPASYARRRPEQTALYQVVREHAETVFARAAERSASGRGYPAHVEREFRRYLACGILAHGFLRVHCAGCGRDELVAFSCKGRAVCPSCVGRRMAETAARLVDERLPQARYRQWVFSFPWRLRLALAKDGELLAEVLRACVRKVFVHQRRQARARGIADAETLAVAFVQRFGSLLQLNPHAHVVIPDAVWSEGQNGELAQHELEPPGDAEVAAVGMAVVAAVTRAVERASGRLEAAAADDEATVEALAEAAGRVGGGARPEDACTSSPGRRVARIESEWGMFSIHANTAVEAHDRAGLERLLRYAGRGPLSVQRVSRTETGKVRYRLRKRYYTGQTELVLEPEAFVRRLAALVPPARQNQVRYYGLLASQARDRDRLCALVDRDDASVAGAGLSEAKADRAPSPWRAARRMRWAQLLARVFGEDVLTCPRCGGPRAILAALTDVEVVGKVLSHLGLPTEAPVAAPARAPPQLDWTEDSWPVA